MSNIKRVYLILEFDIYKSASDKMEKQVINNDTLCIRNSTATFRFDCILPFVDK